ncbi:patatin family protein [Clostridium sp. MB40-C1]|uniref:patatin-like phospholipase family protein n=1 Tax=Clostridium sp. MB40-C1 TaxID=3070996 RepID=UPI0027E16EB3|nr:patatin family protein [Clostridium sp. MB40-C1]WMJ79428.1 patatin family protein [Clostridium sp. MB40-C1]
MKNIGLVLEGGGMRGLYTAGILDYFMEKNLYFPYVVAVSAGACNATSYISKQKERNKRINIHYIKDPRYLSYRNLIKERSIFGMDFLFNEIPNKLEPFDFEAFKSSNQKFIIGTTDCKTGRTLYFDKDECKDILKVIRASSSIPLLAPIVELEEQMLLDGGVTDSIPIRKAKQDGMKRNIIVLTRNKGYRKEPYKFKALVRRVYKKYPFLAEAIFNRHDMYNTTLDYIEELEEKNEVFVFRPSKPLKVDRLEKKSERLEELYEMGYVDAKESYEKMVKWIEE